MVRLRRTFPDQPGWTRRKAGRGFVYLDRDGSRLPEEAVERIRALAIPPAWRDVWITPHENGHLQAVGTDDAGRRQYLYHPQWRARRDAAKFDRVLDFGAALGRARPRLLEDLARDGMPQERACAVAVRLLDLGCFRIGDDVYGDRYGSYGLTTLERAHVRRTGGVLVFRFTGKSGITHRIEIDDEPVCTAIETMRRRRDDEAALLAFRGPDGWRRLTPALVNDYVRASTGTDATAKDFRTWHGTVLAATHLAENHVEGASATARKRAIAATMREVAAFLGNTPAVARASYVDPRVVSAFEEGRTIERAVRRRHPDADARQLALERATIRLIRD
ncbi:DNA topoisomerase IB [Microbacterium sediminis]|uniref:DNA topoisomerase n=1 Tax=Microbacterium sediminis TaxID=904291 RepID=A0A1B9N9N3_9MICO|nr:DNA topoisomerase IB [Microbacterium sediminis]OCG73296.1 DNA topoisomerase [Microbacterium sediminis]QBR75187.1 DNA topoisomerase IB [Microbacterium sediminis]